MTTVFARIINGEIPCQKIAEDDRFLAFLDIRPIAPGHTLVIPKEEVDYFFDLDDALLAGIMVFSKKIAVAIKKSVECQRIGIMVAGVEVPHAHVHLVPIKTVGDLNFAKARPADQGQLTAVAAEIRKHLR